MTNRSPASVFFLILITFGIYGIFWYAGTRNEMVARGADIPGIWFLFIPVLNLIFIWKWCQGVERVTNGSTSAVGAFLLILFLSAIGAAIIQGAFNKVAA